MFWKLCENFDFVKIEVEVVLIVEFEVFDRIIGILFIVVFVKLVEYWWNRVRYGELFSWRVFVKIFFVLIFFVGVFYLKIICFDFDEEEVFFFFKVWGLEIIGVMKFIRFLILIDLVVFVLLYILLLCLSFGFVEDW